MTETQHQTPSTSPAPVAHSVPNTEHDTRELWEALMQYRPFNVTPADWDRVQDFARQAVVDYGPPNIPVGTRMLSVVTHYVIWATNNEHVPLDRAELFHPTLLGRYVRMRAPKKQSSLHKTLHSLLFRVASAVADVDHNRKKRGRISHGVIPYNARELAELESWAVARKNAVHRRYAKTFLALAGGAGLQSVECAHVRGRDVVRSDAGYSVHVTGRYPRTVPIQTEWASYLDDVFDDFDADQFVLFPGQADDARVRTLKWFCVGAHPAPFAQRLRDTWVLSQLPVLPLGALMHAAGMPDVQTLRRYLPRITATDLAGWDTELREPSAHLRPAAADGAWTAGYCQMRDATETPSRLLTLEAAAEGARRAMTAYVRDQTAVPAGSAHASTSTSTSTVGTVFPTVHDLEPDWMPVRSRSQVPSDAPRSPRKQRSTAGPDAMAELKAHLQERRTKDGGDAR